MNQDGYFAMADCFCCGRFFAFNPDRVPSWSPSGERADRRPICNACMIKINDLRRDRGLPPFDVDRLAYAYRQAGGEPEDFGP